MNVCKTEAAWREQLREKKNYTHHKENNLKGEKRITDNDEKEKKREEKEENLKKN